MVVIDLERLFALPQHAGDLSVGHPVVVAEVEDQPLLERQLQDRLRKRTNVRSASSPHSSATRLARMRLTSSSEEKSPGLRRRSIVSAVFVAMR